MLNLKYQNYTDERLVEDAQKGDEIAENLLFENYKDLVIKISRHYFLIGGDLEDLVQEGMIGLYKAIKNYKANNISAFKTFASLCINRQIQTAIKRANTKKNISLSTAIPLMKSEDEDEEDSAFLLSEEDMPIEKLIEKENIEGLVLQIEKTLSKKENEVLKLYLSGLSYTEIAEKLNINSKSVDNALSRIKQKLSFLKK